MGMITSIRAPVPVAEAQITPAPATRSQGATVPVAATAPEQAVPHVAPNSATNHPDIMATRMGVEDSAAAAAKAAREAYIKASIAAGINPLPVP